MIAEAGLAALWLAAAMALLQLVGGLTLLRGGAGQLVPLIKPAAYVQGALCTLAFFALMWLFYVTDLSVLLVASNSHIDKPIIFKLAGTWGNHEGSMLLKIGLIQRHYLQRSRYRLLLHLVSLHFYYLHQTHLNGSCLRHWKAQGLTRYFRMLVSPFIRQRFTWAMLVYRLHFPLLWGRC